MGCQGRRYSFFVSSQHSIFSCYAFWCFFFFQAEDGIRDIGVTGVQTCALPISVRAGGPAAGVDPGVAGGVAGGCCAPAVPMPMLNPAKRISGAKPAYFNDIRTSYRDRKSVV